MPASSGGTRFFVELPADEDGNTAFKKAVIEARVEQDPRTGQELLIPGSPWGTVTLHGMQGLPVTILPRTWNGCWQWVKPGQPITVTGRWDSRKGVAVVASAVMRRDGDSG